MRTRTSRTSRTTTASTTRWKASRRAAHQWNGKGGLLAPFLLVCVEVLGQVDQLEDRPLVLVETPQVFLEQLLDDLIGLILVNFPQELGQGVSVLEVVDLVHGEVLGPID